MKRKTKEQVIPTIIVIILMIWLFFAYSCNAQKLFIEYSLDPSITIGNCTLEKPGLDQKVCLGYNNKRLNIFAGYENYHAIKFNKYFLNTEIVVFDFDIVKSTFYIGYGFIFRDYMSWGKSYSIGGRILFYVNDKINIFVNHSIDGRPDLVGNPDGHLKNKCSKLKYVESIHLGVMYLF